MIKKYDILYSKDSSDNIRIWFMEQDGSRYRTISGVKDSPNLVESEYTVCEGKNVGKKNETSGECQATKEIEARYKKQLKTGYFKSIDDVGTFQYVEAMRAEKYKERIDKIDFSTQNWGLQCKFNGNRCIATKSGLTTRKGETWKSTPHIHEALIKFFEKWPDAVLDGELFNYELRQSLNELSKLVKKRVHITPEDLVRSKELVKFNVYDGWNFDDMDENTPYSKRKNWIDKNVVGKYDYIEEVVTYPIKSKSELDKQYNIFLEDGQEGGILRDLDSGYEHRRSNNLLKIKQDEDDECIILSIMDGDGNWAGAATTATVKWKDKEFDCTFKGSYEVRAEIFKNKKDLIIWH